jgi:hypothetical protein
MPLPEPKSRLPMPALRTSPLRAARRRSIQLWMKPQIVVSAR